MLSIGNNVYLLYFIMVLYERKTIYLVFFVLFFSCLQIKTDVEQIKDCFTVCQKGIREKDGEKVSLYVDRETLLFYSKLLDDVIYLDSSELTKKDFSVKLSILSIRHMVPPEQILALDGRSLLILAIKKGVAGNHNIGKYTLGNIDIKDSSASAAMLVNDNLTPFRYGFHKEGIVWKIHLRTSTDETYKQLYPKSSVSENEFFKNVLEQISGVRPTDVIWKPISTKPV